MKIVVNGSEWNIYEKPQKEITDRYNKDLEENAICIFGLTIFTEHEIWINKDMIIDQKIKALKHELTHCYIESFGLGQAPHYTEEMVCDLVSSITDFINRNIEKYKREMMKNGECAESKAFHE